MTALRVLALFLLPVCACGCDGCQHDVVRVTMDGDCYEFRPMDHAPAPVIFGNGQRGVVLMFGRGEYEGRRCE